MADFFKQNWGNVASVFGLVVSLSVLWVARKARQAAEEARAVAGLKSLVEELEMASTRARLMGVFLRSAKWEVTRLLVEEALTTCRATLSRWGEFIESRNDLRTACTLFQTIARNCEISAARELTPEEWQLTMRAQLEASEKLSTVLGAGRRAEEGRT